MDNLKIYNIYRWKHIEHHSTCPLCKWPTIRSNLYWQDWYLECIACKNQKWEWYFFKPLPPLSKEEFEKTYNFEIYKLMYKKNDWI